MTENTTPALRTRDLAVRYETAGGTLTAVKEINISVEFQDFYVIVGPSGCGKSSLLKALASLQPSDGTIELSGERVTGPGPDRIMVFQDFDQLLPWKTISANVEFALKSTRRSAPSETEARVKESLTQVGLWEFRNSYPHELSGGMKQRAAIARSMALKPAILMMDEPFGALDAQTRRIMQQEIRQLWRTEATTVLFVTHSVREAVLLGTTIAVMSPGPEGTIVREIDNRKVQEGSTTDPAFVQRENELTLMLDSDAGLVRVAE